MFTLDEVLSKSNQKETLEFLTIKGNSRGAEGMFMSDLEEYWNLNGQVILKQLQDETYEPGLAKSTEIINKKGKRRLIYNLPAIDRFISRMLSQKLRQHLEPEFMKNSFAYQENKGVVDAVGLAQSYISEGKKYVVEIDLKDYFEQIPHDKMIALLGQKISDKRVVNLIYKYLCCTVMINGRVTTRERGLLQGNSMSPVLSNLYLDAFDRKLQEKELSWLRFADNIYVYCTNKDEGADLFNALSNMLENEFKLQINTTKSGVYDAMERWVLGYEFVKVSGKIVAQKHLYTKKNQYGNWHPSALEHIEREYHIVQGGVLNKNDYSLLFENDEENGIRLCFVDKYGNLIGSYVPSRSTQSAMVLLKQAQFYVSEKRFKMALAFEKSNLHNMRAVLRYYNKKKKGILSEQITQITQCIDELTKKSSVRENGAVFLNEEGKRLFIEYFEQKLDDKVFDGKKQISYRQLIYSEVLNFQQYIEKDIAYKPYKYY